MESELVLVYVTTPTLKEAKSIAKHVVAAKLAACCNVYDDLISIYQWEGKLQEDSECSIFIKTKKELFDKLKDEILKIHSYDNPCVIMLPITDGSEQFLKWVNDEI